MTSPQQLLWSLRAAGVIDAVDAHVALRLGRRARLEDAEVFAALALAVRAPRHGHVCVDLATADLAHLRPPDAEGEAPTLPEDRATWAAAVGDAAVVRRSTTSPRLPFHLEGTQLYTDRYWTYQQQVATRLQELSTRPLRTPGDPQRLQAALHRLFRPADQASKPALNRQQLAAASASLRDLTVITTALPIASELQYCDTIDVILLGGRLRRDAPDLSGAITLQTLEALHADIAFLGSDAIDLKGSCYNESTEVAHLIAAMSTVADAVYVVADSSKIGHAALGRTGSLKRWDGLITDKGLSPTATRALRRQGVKILFKTAQRRKKR